MEEPEEFRCANLADLFRAAPYPGPSCGFRRIGHARGLINHLGVFPMRLLSSAALAATLVLFVSATALAKGSDISPADLAVLKSYTLSMGQDQRNAGRPWMTRRKAAWQRKCTRLATTHSRLPKWKPTQKAMPGAMAIFAKHGLTAHDAVVLPLAMMDAGMCVAYPTAAAAWRIACRRRRSRFYKQHQAELKKMKWLSGGE